MLIIIMIAITLFSQLVLTIVFFSVGFGNEKSYSVIPESLNFRGDFP